MGDGAPSSFASVGRIAQHHGHWGIEKGLPGMGPAVGLLEGARDGEAQYRRIRREVLGGHTGVHEGQPKADVRGHGGRHGLLHGQQSRQKALSQKVDPSGRRVGFGRRRHLRLEGLVHPSQHPEQECAGAGSRVEDADKRRR